MRNQVLSDQPRYRVYCTNCGRQRFASYGFWRITKPEIIEQRISPTVIRRAVVFNLIDCNRCTPQHLQPAIDPLPFKPNRRIEELPVINNTFASATA